MNQQKRSASQVPTYIFVLIRKEEHDVELFVLLLPAVTRRASFSQRASTHYTSSDKREYCGRELDADLGARVVRRDVARRRRSNRSLVCN